LLVTGRTDPHPISPSNDMFIIEEDKFEPEMIQDIFNFYELQIEYDENLDKTSFFNRKNITLNLL
jgi:hypothetical protein